MDGQTNRPWGCNWKVESSSEIHNFWNKTLFERSQILVSWALAKQKTHQVIKNLTAKHIVWMRDISLTSQETAKRKSFKREDMLPSSTFPCNENFFSNVCPHWSLIQASVLHIPAKHLIRWGHYQDHGTSPTSAVLNCFKNTSVTIWKRKYLNFFFEELIVHPTKKLSEQTKYPTFLPSYRKAASFKFQELVAQLKMEQLCHHLLHLANQFVFPDFWLILLSLIFCVQYFESCQSTGEKKNSNFKLTLHIIACCNHNNTLLLLLKGWSGFCYQTKVKRKCNKSIKNVWLCANSMQWHMYVSLDLSMRDDSKKRLYNYFSSPKTFISLKNVTSFSSVHLGKW